MSKTTHYELNTPIGSEVLSVMTGLNPNFTTIDGVMYDNETRSTQALNKANVNEQNIATALGRVTTAEGKITNLESNLDTTNTNVTGLTSRIDTAESNITAHNNRITENSNAITENTNEINQLKNRLVIVTLSYNSALNRFPIPEDVPVPARSQVTVIVRNVQNGGIYACWYDDGVRAFELAHIIGGNAPNNGNTCVFEYIV